MNTKLLRTTLPHEDESLASYIYRLSKENSCPIEWLLKEFGLRPNFPISKLNILNNIKNVKRIELMTPLNEMQIREMTIYNFDYLLLDGFSRSERINTRFNKLVDHNVRMVEVRSLRGEQDKTYYNVSLENIDNYGK